MRITSVPANWLVPTTRSPAPASVHRFFGRRSVLRAITDSAWTTGSKVILGVVLVVVVLFLFLGDVRSSPLAAGRFDLRALSFQ